MNLRATLSIILAFVYCLMLKAQQTNYEVYDNIGLTTEATSINCFAQDSQGLIWIGSNRGLFSYDGFSAHDHSSDNTSSQIYSLAVVNSNILVLGTDEEILFYNYEQDKYIDHEINFPTDVRSMALDGDILWLGSLNGLSTYNLNTNELKVIDLNNNPGIPHKAIYAIQKSVNGKTYIGTYNGLCQYDSELDIFERIQLPQTESKSNQFVNTILDDSLNHCIWIGTEGNLYQYDIQTEQIQSLPIFKNNSVKSLTIHENNALLVGTDNGLYVYSPQTKDVKHIVHDSRNDHSLSNNIIWSIFTDKEKNIWLGTDYKISLLRNDKLFRTIRISQITGIGDGNRFHAIYRNSENSFWLGGANGLIHTSSLDSKADVRWYKMGDNNYPLSHNRVRNIYEDKDQNIWIATDGSINKFDPLTNQFINYPIVDSTHTFNANWAYSILEDKENKLWIGTFLGGLFVVDKQKLINNKDGLYVADQHYNTNKGLSGNNVNQILQDKLGNIWVLFYNHGINRINPQTNEITVINIPEDETTSTPNYILADKDGTIWVGRRNGLVCIDPETLDTETIAINIFGDCEILSMVETDTNIWLSTSSGIIAVDKQTHKVHRLNISSNSYTAGFYDKYSGNIYWGTSDELAVLSPQSAYQYSHQAPILLTALYINNKPYKSQIPDIASSIRYTDEITLKHKQNNLIFEFSDLVYSQEESNRFVYRLEGVDKKWNILPQNINRIIYNNLEYGTYQLSITSLAPTGQPSDQAYHCAIIITPPWYYTWWAKVIYILLSIAFILWIINFFRVRNNLKLERLEKAKTVELTNLKLDFFTDVSHEFKTPLSLIIAPVSKLLMETKNPQRKEQLNTILRNALKLNSLTRQIIDFNREDRTNSELILSQVEFVQFAQSLFSVYEDGYKDKGLKFIFSSNEEQIYINIDVLKMEATLNNLLSNACKYTNEGEISLKLISNEEQQSLKIIVEDTGIGIPKNEQPYAYERFFQSSKTVNEKEGTGIGLFLVKSYVEQHQGIVELESEENKGTQITITLPIVKIERTSKKAETTEDNADKPLILIVEDNTEIADFIYNILSASYRCEVCNNGKQGLTRCLELLPDLVVADIMMPIMDGLEMTRQIRRNIPTSTTPIILLTAKDDRITELESINLKVDAFIPKPFDPVLLLSRIDQILESKQLIENKIRLETITEVEPITAISPDEKFLSEITTIIEDKIDDPELNVKVLSDTSGYGAKQLYRKTKQLTGKTPVEYIRTIRLKKAAMLLSKNKFTVSEVMYMVGFSSSSYFAKCFQQEFGRSPKEFTDKSTNN